MTLVLLLYIISVISWGTVLLQLTKIIIATSKSKKERPPLLIPLAIASLALFIESTYFGVSALFMLMGRQDLFLATFESSNWILVKLLIAISGVLLSFNLKVSK